MKLVNEIDAKEAARQGLITRPLTIANVQKHLEDFGLEPEFGTHSRIRGLSGGHQFLLALYTKILTSVCELQVGRR